ncbi:hypothetical protein ACFP1I_25820 [Dyadobacter subterraneus]|uniref:Uncharacterized protein n=1 Tax=Dyadobacter subterraneus TaxID=2773304 RepID=A0ABR9WJW9_9BACT|nr:hypothetical protein [Dyadobacter subterraneus]MBE9465802.1 hypothetical protein [Dyadobacter subterraneus]
MKIISPKYIFGIAFLFLSLGSLKTFSNENPSLHIAEKFVSFSARLEKSELVLNWKVSPGDVNKGFEIQKSLDGKLFEKIGYLKENETSKMQTDYSFVDKELPLSTPYIIV